MEAKPKRDFYREFVIEVTDNLPESLLCLRCTDWDYDKRVFYFEDDEECKSYRLGMLKLVRGLKRFEKIFQSGTLHFCGCETMSQFWDAGCWDACVMDAFVQVCIFGKVIYG